MINAYNSIISKKEVWKPIHGYTGMYECSNCGRIKSLARKGKPKDFIMKQRLDNFGYQQAALTKNSKTQYKRVHRLVAKLFVPNPKNKPHVNHLDGNKSNPFYLNLQWCTHSENHKHAYLAGLKKMPLTVLSEKDVMFIYKSKLSTKDLSKKFKVGIRNIRHIKVGQTWKHVTGGNYITLKNKK